MFDRLLLDRPKLSNILVGISGVTTAPADPATQGGEGLEALVPTPSPPQITD